jgi:hypothetical protein
MPNGALSCGVLLRCHNCRSVQIEVLAYKPSDKASSDHCDNTPHDNTLFGVLY